MTAPDRSAAIPDKPSFAELYTPKLVTILREGYGLRDLRADVISGLTVAIVAIRCRWRSPSPRVPRRTAASIPPSSAAS